MYKKEFYLNNIHQIANTIIGDLLVVNGREYEITEVEVYTGSNDPASHAYKGISKRNAPMYEEGGTIYVYLIYGMYYCFNIVTGAKSTPEAILIRGLLDHSGYLKDKKLNGPGKICRELGIDKSYNNKSLSKKNSIYIRPNTNKENVEIKKSQRVGIKNGLDLMWRYQKI
jgi:DNA-3-methyladenine glycosylase